MSQLMFLLLEDSLLDSELIRATLTEGGITCELMHVTTADEFTVALKQKKFDMILSDYSLPGFDGIAALEIAQQYSPNTPFIFVTATMGEEVAIDTLKLGATDYVLKQRLGRIVPSVMRALREVEEHDARKKAENDLHEREQEFKALVENSTDVIARIDGQLRYVYINPAIKGATGIPVSVLTGKNAAELGFPRQIYAEWEERLRQVFASGIGCFFEFDFMSPNGMRYYQARVEPEFSVTGEVRSLLTIARDVTDYKNVEQALRRNETELREQKEELEKLNSIKDEFLAVLSHELRSPLNAILGWSKILRSRKLDSVTFERALETIERNAKLQTQLIEDLLDVSRIIRGKLTLHPQPTNLVLVIEAAIDTMRLAAQAKSISLQFQILEDEILNTFKASNNTSLNGYLPTNNPIQANNFKFRVLGDSSRLQQIIWNLVSNAIKFTPTGGEVQVLLQLAKQEGESRHFAKITVKDTGMGIKSDFIPYVFESFRQADGSTTRRFGGLGLGLAIVRHLAELHGGKIDVSSAGEGKGATFTLQIPLIPSPETKTSSTLGQNLTSITTTEIVEPSSQDKPLLGIKILVVDDDDDSRNFLTFALTDSGAKTNSVESAELAIDAVQRFQPNLIVSDIGMPQEDGYSLIKRIRQLPKYLGGNIPAIALTAYAGDTDRQKAISAGFQTHLAKPVMPDELIGAVIELVGQGVWE
ncbi:response regulator [Calothrix sp. PCC 6303]|uniref:hybrid sensor histidine kinase/response regulator n=1 Tax=Calothrix sp. PCC 6303 TaxID=1170562 RepID=UPI0002A03720|nr:response regulator [Calothrix sp. PCC 6303]AFZ03617.1 PAS/PAC sensor hybrid histidine kinase [Calothrix sp. PCC 6303]